MCHDDVIGDRAVSFIIYLVDPDGWSADDGGALELYPLSDLSKVSNKSENNGLRSQGRHSVVGYAFTFYGLQVDAFA